MNQDQVNAELEFSRLMQVDYRPRIEGLMVDGEIFDEPGLSAEALEPLLRGAFEAGRRYKGDSDTEALDRCASKIIRILARPLAELGHDVDQELRSALADLGLVLDRGTAHRSQHEIPRVLPEEE